MPQFQGKTRSMWHTLQITIIIAVIFSNIHWEWTPNQLLAGIIGWVVAFLATVAVDKCLYWFRFWCVTSKAGVPR